MVLSLGVWNRSGGTLAATCGLCEKRRIIGCIHWQTLQISHRIMNLFKKCYIKSYDFNYRWRIFNGCMQMSPDNVDTIVKATLVLHNYFKTNNARYWTHIHEIKRIATESIKWKHRIICNCDSRQFQRLFQQHRICWMAEGIRNERIRVNWEKMCP